MSRHWRANGSALSRIIESAKKINGSSILSNCWGMPGIVAALDFISESRALIWARASSALTPAPLRAMRLRRQTYCINGSQSSSSVMGNPGRREGSRVAPRDGHVQRRRKVGGLRAQPADGDGLLFGDAVP